MSFTQKVYFSTGSDKKWSIKVGSRLYDRICDVESGEESPECTIFIKYIYIFTKYYGLKFKLILRHLTVNQSDIQ